MTASRNINAPRHVWTPEELADLTRRYPDERTAAIAADIGLSVDRVYRKAHDLGLTKSAAFLASAASGRMGPGTQLGAASRFKPGQKPATAGTKGINGQHPNSQAHRFQKGHTLNGVVPLGTVKMMSNGYLMRKVAQTNYPPDDWKMESRLVWEEQVGPIPPDHVVHLKDRDQRNVTVENMELVSRGDIVRRFGINALPPELKQVLHLKGALTRKINRYEQEHATDRA